MHIGIDASRAFLAKRTGTEEYSYQLIRSLAKIDRKNNYTLYIKSYQSLIPSSSFPNNFQMKIIAWPYLWTQVGLAIEVLRNPPDVLFIPAHTLPVIRRSDLKTTVTIHDLGAEFLPQYHQFPQKLYLNRSTEYAIRHATHIIAVSQSTKDDLINKLGCDPKKISVVYEGLDKEKFDPPSGGEKRQFKNKKCLQQYGIESPYILFVGTVQPRKNLVRLIEAFSLICYPEPFGHSERSEESQGKLREGSLSRKDSSPRRIGGRAQNDIKLVIVGKPGWMHEEIYAAPKKFGIKERVRFLDYVPKEDLPMFYQNAFCFTLPSLYEGFGLPVLEAMACGCPVIASKISSLPELVGEAGLLVDPLNIEDIAQNLQLIINNLKLREDLIKKGLKQVKKFSWEKCSRETLKVLEDVSRSIL